MDAMDRQPALPNLLTTGQMAQLNGVSKKTLRLYQERGLLIPAHVDEESGYRYYKLEQCAQLDIIQQFQAIGFSLQPIGDILQKQDVRGLSALMRQQVSVLDQEIERLTLARDAARRMQESCDVVLNKPPCEQITVEWMPARRYLYFDVKRYDYSDFTDIQREGFVNWEMTLRLVKRQMTQLGLPLSLFQNVCCITDNACLLRGDFVVTGAAIQVDRNFTFPGCTYYELPAGLYISCYCEGDENGTLSFTREAELVHRLLEEIKSRGYALTGDYLGDVMADTPVFRYAARESFLRLQIGISNATR